MFQTLNHRRKLILSLVAGLAMASTAQAVGDRPNSYQSIARRNVFRLKPVSEPEIRPATQMRFTITLQGVASFFGVRQVLFKVLPPRPGEAERSFVLSEGQSQDGIEVLSIDEKRGCVQFNNQGELQTLMLHSNGATLDNRRVLQAVPVGNPQLKTLPVQTKPQQPVSSAMSVAEQTILIEVERERTKSKVEAGTLPPLPPTPLTPPGSLGAAASGVGRDY
jgi:hypothetical protein